MAFEWHLRPRFPGLCTTHDFPNKHKLLRHSLCASKSSSPASRKLEKPGGCQNPLLSLDCSEITALGHMGDGGSGSRAAGGMWKPQGSLKEERLCRVWCLVLSWWDVACSEPGELTELLTQDRLYLCCPQRPEKILFAMLARGGEPPLKRG